MNSNCLPVRCSVVLCSLLWAGLVPAQESPEVSSPPSDLGFDEFYSKYLPYRNLPILSSSRVPDQALHEARRLVALMVAKHPSLVEHLIEHKVRVVVMALSEKTTEVPEHRDLSPKTYWDRRARGLGATRSRPACSCAEENLLRYRNDPYAGESILIHEFAHTLHELAIVDEDGQFDSALREAYTAAMRQGLWQDTYAATNHKEYWAEGVQSWFNVNREATKPDGVHNGVNTHRELRDYDPRLYKLISQWFNSPPSLVQASQ